MSYVVRPWALRDLKDVMRLIREGATFHKALDQVKTTPEVLREDGFGMDPKFGCLVAEVPPDQRSKDGHTVVGYQFHYFSYCTWKGRIVFGEDLYVMPEFRGKGIGTSLLSQVAKLALAHGCSQFRFVLANWNQPAMALYEKLGAINVTARDNWVVWHIEGRAMQELAERVTQ
ncbi:diamine acetyltransferase 2-like isoform X2 [Trachemys scripta elegans]|uniref:diamine acetyltransferase 2-like isoform X2 n=1 Tax=Trachemys scripta elegans TaxID=31138 RepID=UPI0015540F64|nr:diamine acetyltransferase 2-like isoform X2 [Trachemys scripta elegans]